MTAITEALEFVCTVKYNEVTTLYSQIESSQSGDAGARATRVTSARIAREPASLPTCKLVTNGSGKVWAVDENGKPLGIITKSHPTLDTQGFQRIQDYALQQQSAKLLHGKSRVCFCNMQDIVQAMQKNSANCAKSWHQYNAVDIKKDGICHPLHPFKSNY